MVWARGRESSAAFARDGSLAESQKLKEARPFSLKVGLTAGLALPLLRCAMVGIRYQQALPLLRLQLLEKLSQRLDLLAVPAPITLAQVLLGALKMFIRLLDQRFDA